MRSVPSGVLASSDRHVYNMQVELEGRTRCFNLHKAAIADPMVAVVTGDAGSPGQVILLEDLTDLEALEAELSECHAEILLQSLDDGAGAPALAVARGIRIEVNVFWREGLRPRKLRLAMTRM